MFRLPHDPRQVLRTHLVIVHGKPDPRNQCVFTSLQVVMKLNGFWAKFTRWYGSRSPVTVVLIPLVVLFYTANTLRRGPGGDIDQVREARKRLKGRASVQAQEQALKDPWAQARDDTASPTWRPEGS